ncbi:MAG: hypothetical protein EA369_07220 [Bradymonadales bacterium]|nr:MAG: hypothetical protein EA369_07220 [Bradymonadales bacterium]
MEKKPLSRIVRGSSEDLQSIRTEPKRAEAQSYGTREFRRHISKELLTLSEAQAMVEKAVTEAKRQGQKETEAKLKQSVQEALSKIEVLVSELSQYREEILKEAEADVLDLLGRISKKVLGAELEMKPEILKKIVEDALRFLAKEKKLRIGVNPKDLTLFKTLSTESLFEAKERPDLEVKTEPELSPGQFSVGSERVELEVSIDKMVDEVLKPLIASLNSAKETGDEGDKV